MNIPGNDSERVWNEELKTVRERRITEMCKAADFYAPWFQRWTGELGERTRFHRKQWEFVYIMQALWERGCIAEGKRGLVFAAGTEPLPAMFAKYGCRILATDIFPEMGEKMGWTHGNQLCFGVDSLNQRGICPDAVFRKLVTYRAVDMRDIPADIKDFDFSWSSCSFEHLGSLEEGFRFIHRQLDTLKPGGWSVHTTEYNVSSDEETQDHNETVIYRQQDIIKLADELRAEGHFVERMDFSAGGLPQDYQVDIKPHKQEVHLKLQEGKFVVTSLGLIIRKKNLRR